MRPGLRGGTGGAACRTRGPRALTAGQELAGELFPLKLGAGGDLVTWGGWSPTSPPSCWFRHFPQVPGVNRDLGCVSSMLRWKGKVRLSTHPQSSGYGVSVALWGGDSTGHRLEPGKEGGALGSQPGSGGGRVRGPGNRGRLGGAGLAGGGSGSSGPLCTGEGVLPRWPHHAGLGDGEPAWLSAHTSVPPETAAESPGFCSHGHFRPVVAPRCPPPTAGSSLPLRQLPDTGPGAHPAPARHSRSMCVHMCVHECVSL